VEVILTSIVRSTVSVNAPPSDQHVICVKIYLYYVINIFLQMVTFHFVLPMLKKGNQTPLLLQPLNNVIYHITCVVACLKII